MFLPLCVVDGKTTRYLQIILADVIAMVVDGITTQGGFMKELLEEDKNLHLRTTMTVKHISCLLEFFLTNTYFSFQDRLYEQKEGAAMGSSISPIVSILFLEDFEIRAVATSPCPPTLWKRFVDDTFTIIKKTHKEAFLEHLNSIHNNIQFTSEDPVKMAPSPF